MRPPSSRLTWALRWLAVLKWRWRVFPLPLGRAVLTGLFRFHQEAADLVLLANFSDIITGIQYGRLCFENLKKSILYLLPAGSYIYLCLLIQKSILTYLMLLLQEASRS